jgi:hypothetical protein
MNRYPGIRPFTATDQHLFNGRDMEQRDLFQLIVLNELTVLFGASGTGKTSLLQAGVCPQLEDRNLHAVFIRLNNTELPPEEQVYQKLKEDAYIPDELPAQAGFWGFLKKFWYSDAGEAMTPVIVFDQFEELFTLYEPEERRNFVSQLAAVVNGLAPAMPGEMADGESAGDWRSPPQVKFVLSIRSDFLYLLDELSSAIPAILRCRFHLKPLSTESAGRAITQPAGLAGNFVSPPFSFSKTALDNIISSLGREEKKQLGTQGKPAEPEIEAFQLQLLCRHIEQKILDEKCSPGFEVTPGFYGGEAGIRRIIGEFLTQLLQKLPEEQQLNTEKLLGRGLIRNGRRIIMEESAIREEFGLPQAVLDFLHHERLLKKEARKGNLYYEISHDTLIEPVSVRYREIIAGEQAEKAEKERLDRERELTEERRKRRRNRRLAIAGFTLSLIALCALIAVIWQSARLRAANLEIIGQAFNSQLQAARTLKVEGKYDAALETLGSLEKMAAGLGENRQTEVRQLQGEWLQVKHLMTTADSLASLEAYYLAGQFYVSADSTSPDQQIKKQIQQNAYNLERKFEALKAAGERFETAGALDLAKDNYQKARELKPTDNYILKKLKSLE